MNEYQEALETMCKRCSNHEMCQGTGCSPKKELQRLVDKATIKMPFNDGDTLFCNICRFEVGHSPNNDGVYWYHRYCPECGQRLGIKRKREE